MPHQEPGTTQEEPIVEASAPQQPAAYAQGPPAYEPIAGQDEWLAEPEELPRRPRRRLFGKGGNPIFLALLGVLLIACGFIGGVLIEKGETSSSTGSGAAASLASRFRALRGGTGSTATGGSAGASSGFVRPTAGTVAYLAGSTLYVTNSEGNTVKVNTSVATSVTETVKTKVKSIHPGETVTVTGATGSNGAVSAESISVGSSGSGTAALFGGSAKTGSGTGVGAALFGSG